MAQHLPNILRTIYSEDRVRDRDDSENVMALLKAFQSRRLDTRYLYLLETNKKE